MIQGTKGKTVQNIYVTSTSQIGPIPTKLEIKGDILGCTTSIDISHKLPHTQALVAHCLVSLICQRQHGFGHGKATPCASPSRGGGGGGEEKVRIGTGHQIIIGCPLQLSLTN